MDRTMRQKILGLVLYTGLSRDKSYDRQYMLGFRLIYIKRFFNVYIDISMNLIANVYIFEVYM